MVIDSKYKIPFQIAMKKEALFFIRIKVYAYQKSIIIFYIVVILIIIVNSIDYE